MPGHLTTTVPYIAHYLRHVMHPFVNSALRESFSAFFCTLTKRVLVLDRMLFNVRFESPPCLFYWRHIRASSGIKIPFQSMFIFPLTHDIAIVPLSVSRSPVFLENEIIPSIKPWFDDRIEYLISINRALDS